MGRGLVGERAVAPLAGLNAGRSSGGHAERPQRACPISTGGGAYDRLCLGQVLNFAREELFVDGEISVDHVATEN